MFFWKKEQPTTTSIVTAGVLGGIVGAGATIYYACTGPMSSASNAPAPLPAPTENMSFLANKCIINADKYKTVLICRAELSTAQKNVKDKLQEIANHIRDHPNDEPARNLMYQQLGQFHCEVCKKEQALKEAEEVFDKASV